MGSLTGISMDNSSLGYLEPILHWAGQSLKELISTWNASKEEFSMMKTMKGGSKVDKTGVKTPPLFHAGRSVWINGLSKGLVEYGFLQ